MMRFFGSLCAESEGDFPDVPNGGGEAALVSDSGQATEAGVAMAEELTGVGERTLDRFRATFAEALAPVARAIGVGPLPSLLPDMPVSPRVS